jgi:hypothetical protein
VLGVERIKIERPSSDADPYRHLRADNLKTPVPVHSVG